MTTNTSFSVLMCVYHAELPRNFEAALLSIVAQTRQDYTLVLVKDGPCSPNIDSIIEKFSGKMRIKVLSLQCNMGLNFALNAGLELCEHDLVVRCDSDDINLPNRFDLLVSLLEQDRELAVVSSSVVEFEESAEGIRFLGQRNVPLESSQIRRRAIFRSPFNHPAAAYRKSVVLSVGGYPTCNKNTKMEDYSLWLSVLGGNYKCSNVGEPLVLFRAGRQMLARRSGADYALDELSLVKHKIEAKIASIPVICIVGIARATARLLPLVLLKKVYSEILRDPIDCIPYYSRYLHQMQPSFDTITGI